jgi:DNA-directed RNA polymerases I and III subunit RPAC1
LFKAESEPTEDNCLKFMIHVKCERKPNYKKADSKVLQNLTPEEYLINSTGNKYFSKKIFMHPYIFFFIVYSGDLKWIPVGNQKAKFDGIKIGPVHDNIIIAKLRENQEIEAELICEKGIGKTHAKWSPVSTAFYRLMPDIEITQDILDNEVIH